MKRIRLLIQSFIFAGAGIHYALRTQRNIRMHLGFAIVAMICCLVFAVTKTETLFIFFSIIGVIAAELFNTAIEAVVDLITAEYHPLAKVAKDVAAGAVMWTALGAFFTGVYVFSDKLFPLKLRHLSDLEHSRDLMSLVGFISFLLLFFAAQVWLYYLNRRKQHAADRHSHF